LEQQKIILVTNNSYIKKDNKITISSKSKQQLMKKLLKTK